MKAFTVAGLILGVTMTLGLTACGSSSGSSDVSDIQTAAMQGGDLPSGLALHPPGKADSYNAYVSPSLFEAGKLPHCKLADNSDTRKAFQHGLGQTALFSNGAGVRLCAVQWDSSDSASSFYDSYVSEQKKLGFKTVSVPQVGDQSAGADIKTNTETERTLLFRHGNMTGVLLYANFTDTGTMDQLVVIAKQINKRLK